MTHTLNLCLCLRFFVHLEGLSRVYYVNNCARTFFLEIFQERSHVATIRIRGVDTFRGEVIEFLKIRVPIM